MEYAIDFDVPGLTVSSTIDAETYDAETSYADKERYDVFCRKTVSKDGSGAQKTLSPMNKFMAAMYETCLRNEIPVISGDKCCRLLAWVYIYGGQYEIPLMPKLYYAIMYAQRRLNIMGGMGGESMDLELIKTLQNYIRELEACGSDYDDATPPQWVYDLMAEYDLKPIYELEPGSKVRPRKKLREYLDEGFNE
jgi:hypothetical protein